jgi:putative membrane protein
MTLRWLLAAIHLLGLGIGLGASAARAAALRRDTGLAGLRAAFAADNWWGLSALLLIGTGLLRAFAGYEKGATYYLDNRLFLAKMGLVAVILMLEVRPMTILIRWRRAVARGETPDTVYAPGIAWVSQVQAALLVVMVFLATGMARGYGAIAP